MPGAPHINNGLTDKQEAFARHVACDGMTYADAYRNAYDCSEDTKPDTIHRNAHDVAWDGKVAARIRELKELAANEINWGLKDALEEYEEARELAKKTESAAAMATATSGKAKVLGLDKLNVSVKGQIEHPAAQMSEQERMDMLEAQIPALIPLMEKLGYRVEKVVGGADVDQI